MSHAAEAWPPLPWEAWEPTHAALHRWLQIIGKLRLASMPWTNHSWHVTLSLTARGLTSGAMPFADRFWQADFDFLSDELRITCSDGRAAAVPLRSQSVAQFYAQVREALGSLGIPCEIRTLPSEIPDALPFDEDVEQRPYDADAVRRWWRILLQADRVLRVFRARFRGKSSPVHFFWGAMDLAVSRFSGRPAPPHSGGMPNVADWVMREAYSHEVCSAGFWAGAGLGYPAFYTYAYPEPKGFAQSSPLPHGAFYSDTLHEFVLPYDVVREAVDPDGALLAFLQSTYEAAAVHGNWNRKELECQLP